MKNRTTMKNRTKLKATLALSSMLVSAPVFASNTQVPYKAGYQTPTLTQEQLAFAFGENYNQNPPLLFMTQQEMADKSNVIRETIARIESQITSPQVRTMIKILQPLGYTIKIVSIPKSK